ncbi:MAG: hypothetical protein FWE27_01415 [Defluviitaleaceae bacterium]|nr:hypothetical protein [Defluviitaleaceae bacterium]
MKKISSLAVKTEIMDTKKYNYADYYKSMEIKLTNIFKPEEEEVTA